MLLHQDGLHIERLRFTRFKPQHAWLFLLYPLIWINTRAEIRDADLCRWMMHPVADRR